MQLQFECVGVQGYRLKQNRTAWGQHYCLQILSKIRNCCWKPFLSLFSSSRPSLIRTLIFKWKKAEKNDVAFISVLSTASNANWWHRGSVPSNYSQLLLFWLAISFPLTVWKAAVKLLQTKWLTRVQELITVFMTIFVNICSRKTADRSGSRRNSSFFSA